MRFPRRILQIAVLASFFLVAIIFSPSFAAVDPCGDVADGKVDDACTKPYAYKCDGDAECGYYPSMTAEVIPLVCRDLGTGSGVKYCVKEDNAAAKTCSPQYLCGPDGYYRYKKNFDCSQTFDQYCDYGCDASTGTCKPSPTATTIPDSANPTISMYAAKTSLKVGEKGAITIVGNDDKDVASLSILYNGHSEDYDCSGIQSSCRVEFSQLEFQLGTTTVSGVVNDASGKTASSSITITVSASAPATTTTTLSATAARNTECASRATSCTGCTTYLLCGWSATQRKCLSAGIPSSTTQSEDGTSRGLDWVTSSSACTSVAPPVTTTTTTVPKGGFGDFCTSDSQCLTGKCAIVDKDGGNCVYTTTTTIAAADKVPTASIVSTSSATTGSPITLIGIGTDDKDVYRIEAYYQESWKTYSCEGVQTSCSNAWAITETSPGTYTYYVYAYDSIGQMATTSKTVTVTGSTTIASPKGNLGDACYADAQCASGYCDLDKGECAFKPATTTTIYRSVATTTTIAAGGEPRTLIEGALSAPTATKTEGFSLNIQDYNAVKCFYTIVNSAKGTTALNKERPCNALSTSREECPAGSKCTIIAKSRDITGKESVPATMLVNVVASAFPSAMTTTTTIGKSGGSSLINIAPSVKAVPNIKDVDITPATGPPGTIFRINVVADNTPAGYKYATVKPKGAIESSFTVFLSDAGKEGNDNVLMSDAYSTGMAPGIYTITATLRSEWGMDSMEKDFRITNPKPKISITASPNPAVPGEPITLAVTGYSEINVSRIDALFSGEWHSHECGGKEKTCTNNWMTSESSPGTYQYSANIFDSEGQTTDYALVSVFVGEPVAIKNVEFDKSAVATNNINIKVSASGLPIENIIIYSNHGEYGKSCESRTECEVAFSIRTEKDWKDFRFITVAYDKTGLQSSGTRRDVRVGGMMKYAGSKLAIAAITGENVLITGAGGERATVKKNVLAELHDVVFFATIEKNSINGAVVYMGKDAVNAVSISPAPEGTDEKPKVVITVSPNPAKPGEQITLRVAATDDRGVAGVDAFFQEKWHSKDCDRTQLSCEGLWTFTEEALAYTQSEYFYQASAIDSIDQTSDLAIASVIITDVVATAESPPTIEGLEFDETHDSTGDIKIRVSAKSSGQLSEILLYTNRGHYRKSCESSMCDAEFSIPVDGTMKELHFIATAYDKMGAESSGIRRGLRLGDKMEFENRKIILKSVEKDKITIEYAGRSVDVRTGVLEEIDGMLVYSLAQGTDIGVIYVAKQNINVIRILDAISPKVDEVIVDPPVGPIGTKFTVSAIASDNERVDSVKAVIKFNKATEFVQNDEETLALYDDGEHGDIEANDGYYANVWNSRGKGVITKITVTAKDTNGNDATRQRDVGISAFHPDESSCKEFVPGHNDANAQRINIVYVGMNYGGKEKFIESISKSLDFDGTTGGLFSQEPFKSNKNYFNIWYVDEVGKDSCGKSGVISTLTDCLTASRTLAQACDLPDKKTISLIDADGRSHVFGGVSTVYEKISGYQRPIGSVMVHEMGHLLGDLQDEYYEKISGELQSIFISGTNVWDSVIVRKTSESCISPSNPWHDLIGRGCGDPNKIDCILDYNSGLTEIKCAPGISIFECWTEVACFEEPESKGRFRLFETGDFCPA